MSASKRSFLAYQNAVAQIQFHPLKMCLGLCLKINNQAFRSLDDIDSELYVERLDNQHCEVILQLWNIKRKHGFCRFIADAYKLENTALHFEVFAELDVVEFEVSNIEGISVDSIMRDYARLEPIVTKGTINYYDKPDQRRKVGHHKSTVQKTLKVRFRVFTDACYQKDRNFILQKIAEDSIPYIVALHKISENIGLS